MSALDPVTLRVGDCREVMRELPDASVDAVVTDPPYGLEFMGREWDAPWKHGFGETGYTDGKRMPRPNFGSTRNPVCQVCHRHQRGTRRCQCASPAFDERPADSNRLFQQWCEGWAAECFRVLKPGAHLLAFGGTRTYHRMACAIEDAGFEVRDSLHWIYGSGFPKSLDVSKAIDKAAGAEREVVGVHHRHGGGAEHSGSMSGPLGTDSELPLTAPATPAARQWAGWGTALKPAHEPIILARKPLTGTVAANVLEHGTGALNIDGCRIGDELITAHGGGVNAEGRKYGGGKGIPAIAAGSNPHEGRWPPNILLSEEAAAEMDRQSGTLTSGANPVRRSSDKFRDAYGEFAGQQECTPHRGVDSGGASRFFPVFRYQAKAPSKERPRLDDGTAWPTVKPVELMRWLVRLVTPPGGLVLDPFAGTGTTGQACALEGFRCLLIEQDPTAVALIRKRLSNPVQTELTA